MTLVRSGGAAFNGRDVESSLSGFEVKENPPVTDTAAKGILALEIFDVAFEGISLHLVESGAYAGPIVRWDAFKRLSRGPGEWRRP